MRGSKNVAAIAAVTGSVASLIGGAVVAAGVAGATPPNCQDDLWVTFQAARRLICDEAPLPDGSWWRERAFYTAEHTVPARSSCSGGYYGYSSCTYYPAYFVPLHVADFQRYLVLPSNKLGDEPWNLIAGPPPPPPEPVPA